MLGLPLVEGWAEPPAGNDRAADRPAFDHGVHWATGVLDCADCHTVLTATEPLEAPMPPEAVCAACHEGENRSAWFPRPTSHGPDRLEAHQGMENLDRQDCAVCHRQSPSCTECHHGPADGYLIPREEWLAGGHAHSTDVRGRDCVSCHDLADDCGECHLAEKVEPRNHQSPTWGARHARYGNRVDACVTCHGPPARVCTTCHG